MLLVKHFWKSWSWLAATVGVLLPEILQIVGERSALIPFIEPEYKDAIRLVCLVLVVILRPISQKALRNEG